MNEDNKSEESKEPAKKESSIMPKKPLMGKRVVGAPAIGGGANKFAMKGNSLSKPINKLGGLGAKKDT